mgnify:CR=1 FL=1
MKEESKLSALGEEYSSKISHFRGGVYPSEENNQLEEQVNKVDDAEDHVL